MTASASSRRVHVAKLCRRRARPPAKRAQECADVRIAEEEREIGDRQLGVEDMQPRQRLPNVVDDRLKVGVLLGKSTLQRPRAQPEERRDPVELWRTVSER